MKYNNVLREIKLNTMENLWNNILDDPNFLESNKRGSKIYEIKKYTNEIVSTKTINDRHFGIKPKILEIS